MFMLNIYNNVFKEVSVNYYKPLKLGECLVDVFARVWNGIGCVKIELTELIKDNIK